MSEATTQPQTATPTTFYFTQTVFVPVYVHVNIPLDASQLPQHNGSYDPFNQFINNMFLHSQHNPKPQPKISSEFLSSLPTIDINDQNEFSPCAICLDEFKVGDKAVQLPCSHVFHEDDIKEWLKTNPSCPNCRFELPLEDPELEKARRKRMEDKVAKQQEQTRPTHSDTSTQTEEITTPTTQTESTSTTPSPSPSTPQIAQHQQPSPLTSTTNNSTQTQTDSPAPTSENTQDNTPQLSLPTPTPPTPSPTPSTSTPFGLKRGFFLQSNNNHPKKSSEQESFCGFKKGFLQSNKKQKKNE
eukprot:TRINITY_DN3811_c0_g1_i2.p1 TRINITY_DN3811_c0_g1~~TRINITY_DN3811_c0_g1_i2.p1  ORF type:complete len:300 (-),score=106.69 TRINITY_DN3811_c0_g1_i2:86-985(-)